MAVAFVVLLALEDGAFEAAGGTLVFVHVVRELAGHDLLDFGDSRGDLGSVASATTVLELHGVGCSCFDLGLNHLDCFN